MDTNNVPVIVYIHVCMIGNWYKILETLLIEMKTSNLLKHCQQVNIVALGSSLTELRGLIDMYPPCVIRKHNVSTSNYERETLSLIKNNVSGRSNLAYILYLHTKGVTRNSAEVSDWVKLMTWFLIRKFAYAVQQLTYFDTVGVLLRDQPELHYSGNFWWATSEYLKKLPVYIGPNYLDPEMWLCKANPNYLSLWQTDLDHYEVKYDPLNYREKPFRHITNKIYPLAKLKFPGAGLMNQYIHLAMCIKHAHKEGHRVLVVSNVQTDIFSGKECAASDLFDLPKISEKFAIELIDQRQITSDYKIRDYNWGCFHGGLRFSFLKYSFPFNTNIIDYAEQVEKRLHIAEKNNIVVVHAKIEKDSISHYAAQHGVSNAVYQDAIRRLYKDLLINILQPSDNVFVLTANKQDEFIDWLRTQCQLHIIPSMSDCRELNAAFELTVVRKFLSRAKRAVLSTVPYKKIGSTFSYWLHKHCHFESTSFINQDIGRYAKHDKSNSMYHNIVDYICSES